MSSARGQRKPSPDSSGSVVALGYGKRKHLTRATKHGFHEAMVKGSNVERRTVTLTENRPMVEARKGFGRDYLVGRSSLIC